MKKYKLVKRKTDDGLVEVNEDVPLGKIYHADPDTIETTSGYNFTKDKFWKREVIWINHTWFPLELLEEVE